MQGTTTQGNVQEVTEEQLFSKAEDGVIIHNVVISDPPVHSSEPNELVPDDVRNLISRCLSPSLHSRPDVSFAMKTLTDTADAIEVQRRSSHAVQERRASRQISGMSDCHRL